MNTSKVCRKCNTEVSKANAYTNRGSVATICKLCTLKDSKSYYAVNKQRILENVKTYQKCNRKLINKRKRTYNNEYMKNRLQTDITFKLKTRLRTRVREVLKSKNIHKSESMNKYIGCTVEYLKQHLESQFQPGMTWDNWGVNGWHIDHIIPASLASTAEELYKLCHYTNLQPLWAHDNRLKSDKIQHNQVVTNYIE